MRTILVASLLLTVGLVAAAPVSAEEVRLGPCEVDACLYACIHVRQSCPGDAEACVLFAFRVWCV